MILALDIGGTSVKSALVDEKFNIIKKQETSTSFDNYQTPIIKTVVSFAKAFAEGESISGIGVSATGQVDSRLGKIIGSNGKIAFWEGTEIKQEMQNAFSVHCACINDANAAALGEARLGAGRGYRDIIMLTIGTGVGGGIIIDGRLYGGALGLAGEMGHFTLRADGIPCSCSKHGCYESYASTTALLSLIHSLCEERNESLFKNEDFAELERLIRSDRLNGREIFALAELNKNELVKYALQKWICDIAEGASGLVHIFNPELLLIGGGVSRQERLFIEPLRQKMQGLLMPNFARSLKISAAELGNDAGVLGAAYYVSEEIRAKNNNIL